MRTRRFTCAAAGLLLFVAYSGAAANSKDFEKPRVVLETDYKILKKVADFPPRLVEALAGRINATPLMADPGGRFNATDVVDTGLPMRRLVFAGESSNGAFVYYEHGGRGFHYHLAVFNMRDDPTSLIFAGRFFDRAENLDRLRELIAKDKIPEEPDADKHGFW